MTPLDEGWDGGGGWKGLRDCVLQQCQMAGPPEPHHCELQVKVSDSFWVLCPLGQKAHAGWSMSRGGQRCLRTRSSNEHASLALKVATQNLEDYRNGQSVVMLCLQFAYNANAHIDLCLPISPALGSFILHIRKLQIGKEGIT